MKQDQKIQIRLAELIAMGEMVLSTKRSREDIVNADYIVDSQLAHQWSTSVQGLLARIFGSRSDHYKNFTAQVSSHLTFYPAYCALGILKAAKDDYENGYLFDLKRIVEVEVFDDFLEQAEHLLASGYYQAAAVVAGCVLEDGLRKLCDRNAVSLPQKPKLESMNAGLVKADAYPILVQKRITLMADLRNKAAHGKWQEFTKDDVTEMVAAVRRFLDEYLV